MGKTQLPTCEHIDIMYTSFENTRKYLLGRRPPLPAAGVRRRRMPSLFKPPSMILKFL